MSTLRLTIPAGLFQPEAPEVSVLAAVIAPDWVIHRVLIWDSWDRRYVRTYGWNATRVQSMRRLPGVFRTPQGAKAAALAFNAAFPDFHTRPSSRRLIKAAQEWWTAHRDEFDLEDAS